MRKSRRLIDLRWGCDMDVNININVDGAGNTTVKQDTPPIKKKTRKLRNGRETVLQLPDHVVSDEKPKNILNMLGI